MPAQRFALRSEAMREKDHPEMKRRRRARRTAWELAQLGFAVLCMTAVLLVATHRKAEAFRLGGIIEVVQDGTGEHGKPCYRYTICTMDIHGLRICYTDYVCPNG